MKRIEIVDFLKGYSIVTIVIFHYLQYLQLPSPFNSLIFFGGTGIHLFILLSGFGLYLSYLNKPLTYRTFLKRRFTKIYVPYIVVVILSALISLVIPVYENSLYAFGGHVFLYKMFDENIVGSYGYPLWFISMILQFYLCFNLIVFVKSKLSTKWFLISGVLLSIGWAVFVSLINKSDERVFNSFFLQYYWEFVLGMVMAETVSKNKKIIGADIRKVLLFAIAIICCAFYGFMALKGGQLGRMFNDFFALTGYALIAIAIYGLKLKPINQLFLYISKISFSVYLLHMLVLLTISTLFDSINSIYIVILSLIIITPLSALYQKLVDKFLKFVKL